MDFLDQLETGVLCGDGAIGTMLLAEGVPLARCFEELCVSEPERIRRIHEQYIAAGARVIETNTFGANAVRLERFGMEGRVGEINRAAVELARASAKGKDVFVAGSVGPLGISAEEANARAIDRAGCFREQISALLEGGVDLIFFETFMDFEEIQIAFRAKKALSELPEICSFACAADGRLPSGLSLVDAFTNLQGQGATSVGLNCMNGPGETARLLNSIPREFRVTAYPTAGNAKEIDGHLDYAVTPQEFAEATRELVARGVRLIGGCCGTTPAHIAAIAAVISGERARSG